MELKDVIHFYIGCKVLVDDKEDGLLVGGDYVVNEVNNIYHNIEIQDDSSEDGKIIIPYNDNPDTPLRIKPYLRPLSDIKNTEAFEIYKRYFEKEYAEEWHSDTAYSKVRVKADHALRIFSGQDYITGDFMTVISLVPYLCKQGFDIFDLIPSGQAINSSNIKGGKE